MELLCLVAPVSRGADWLFATLLPPLSWGIALATASYFSQFTKNVMMIALVKSMKNAPTSGTTRNALGAGP